jgi:sugar phosphate isomerase/epimerase
MKLSFMTFVCPDWKIEQVVAFAKEAHYDGVELRVDEAHKHDVSSKSSPQIRKRVKRLFADYGVEVACVATSVAFAEPDPAKRKQAMEEAKRNLDLARDLGAPVVRIFAGRGYPALTPEAAGVVAAAFDEAGEYAKASGTCPMLECAHDIMKGAEEGSEVIRRVKTRNFGVLWNHSQIDEHSFALLKDRLRHIHVHDNVLEPANRNILELAKRMKGINYKGYVSLEIIRQENLPEDLLRETATRLKGYIAEAYRGTGSHV